MMQYKQFSYVAVNSQKKRVKGTIFSESSNDVVHILSGYKLVPLAIKEKSMFLFKIRNWLSLKVVFFKPSKRQKMMFYKQVSDMFEARIPLTKIFSNIAKSCGHTAFKYQLFLVARDIEKGSPLGLSIAKNTRLISRSQLGLLLHSEKSNNIDKAFKSFYEIQKSELATGNKIFLWTMPLVLAIVIAIFSIKYLASTVGQSYFEFFAEFGIQAPAHVNFFFFIFGSDTLINVVLSVVAVIFFVFVLRSVIKLFQLEEVVNGILVRIPFLKEGVRLTNLEHFIKSLIMALSTKMPLHLAIQDSGSVMKQKYYSNQLDHLAKRVYQGYDLTIEIGDLNLFTQDEANMIREAMKSDNIDETVLDLLEFTRQKKKTKEVVILNLSRYFLISILVGMIVYAVSVFIWLAQA